MDYNSELYVCRVNFDKTYKNVVDFFISGKSKAQRKEIQLETFKALAINHLTDFSPIMESDGSGVIEVRGSHDNWLSWNYIVFCNPEFSSRWIYAFIDFVDYEAPNTTLIHYTIDVWQTFHLETAFYESWIDRSHIAKSDDVLGANLEGEPFSATPVNTHDIATVFEPTDWSPQWVLHTCSYFADSGTQNPWRDDKYHYEGLGEDYGDQFGEFGVYITTREQLRQRLEQYGRKSLGDIMNDVSIDWDNFFTVMWDVFGAFGTQDPPSQDEKEQAAYATQLVNAGTTFGELQDHRNELIGLFAIPKWAKENSVWASNNPVNKTQALTLNNTLASGYTPRNAKMLSSVFKAYILYARNGTQIVFKPESFSAAPSITCSCIPLGTTKYYAYISNYGERDKQFTAIPYSSERRVGYDSNTGLNKIINILNNSQSMINSGATVAAGVASKNVEMVAQGAIGLAQSGVTMIDALGQIGNSFGSNGELLDITQARAVLRWADVSPSYNECVHIDKFLDMYGYAQNTIGDLYNAMHTRPRYNYIKSSQPNLRVNANDNFNEKMKNIFTAGTTIWHNINYMYDYDTNNF